MPERSTRSTRLRWLEITADYRCNNLCVGCFTLTGSEDSMDRPEILGHLREARRRGADSLWLGGGEPTMRRDLFWTAAAARKLGYGRVRLQTNGMMLAYPEFSDRCLEAGITEVSFAIKGADTATHDRLTVTPGCHELMCKGIEQMRSRGLRMEGDLLVYRSNQAQLPEMVRVYSEMGLERFYVWLFSTSDQGDANLTGEVPRLSEVVPLICEAMDQDLGGRPDFITSLHTPPCTVPATHHRCLFHAADLDLLVANPGGYTFRLEESPMEGGTYLERCAECALRERCGGLRADYLAIHGDDEFQPVPGD